MISASLLSDALQNSKHPFPPTPERLSLPSQGQFTMASLPFPQRCHSPNLFHEEAEKQTGLVHAFSPFLIPKLTVILRTEKSLDVIMLLIFIYKTTSSTAVAYQTPVAESIFVSTEKGTNEVGNSLFTIVFHYKIVESIKRCAWY